MGWEDLVTDVAAVHRLTRLVTSDDLTAPVRDSLIRGAYARQAKESATITAMRNAGLDPAIPGSWTEWAASRDKNPPKLCTLLVCRWCASTHIAFGVVALRRFWPRWWAPVATVLALSSASTLLAGLEGH